MGSTVTQPRRSRPARGPRGRETRSRIIAAATRLFVRDGYLATTVGAIAAEAGVAVQSLYLAFGSKLGILAAVLDVAIVGDEEPVELLEREWMQRVAAAPDGPAAIAVFVAQLRDVLGRTYPVYAVLQAAAASEAGELLEENKRQRLAGVRAVATALSAKPGFAAGLAVERAGDLLYALASEEQYGLLVVERGWAPEAWEAWLRDLLAAICFPPA